MREWSAPSPSRYKRVIVGGSVVLEDTNTRVAVDILQDIALD
jgi:hypothetical protein